MYCEESEALVNPEEYLSLYKLSQGEIRSEEIISSSLLQSMIKALNSYDTLILLNLLEVEKSENKDEIDNQINEILTELFFVDGYEYTNRMIAGRGSYGYFIYGTFGENEFDIFIPKKKNLTTDNIKNAYYGQYALSIKTGYSCWEVKCMSYKPNVIKKYFKENYSD